MARIGILALLIAALLDAWSSLPAGAIVSPSVGVSASPSSMVSLPPLDPTFPSEVAATVDPRWNFAGDDIVWLVRSLGRGAGSGAHQTRSETVWLVDDATGHVIDSESSNGTVVHEGMIQGGSSGDGNTTSYGGSYGSLVHHPRVGGRQPPMHPVTAGPPPMRLAARRPA